MSGLRREDNQQDSFSPVQSYSVSRWNTPINGTSKDSAKTRMNTREHETSPVAKNESGPSVRPGSSRVTGRGTREAILGAPLTALCPQVVGFKYNEQTQRWQVGFVPTSRLSLKRSASLLLMMSMRGWFRMLPTAL
jgi:hypothetical protein